MTHTLQYGHQGQATNDDFISYLMQVVKDDLEKIVYFSIVLKEVKMSKDSTEVKFESLLHAKDSSYTIDIVPS